MRKAAAVEFLVPTCLGPCSRLTFGLQHPSGSAYVSECTRWLRPGRIFEPASPIASIFLPWLSATLRVYVCVCVCVCVYLCVCGLPLSWLVTCAACAQGWEPFNDMGGTLHFLQAHRGWYMSNKLKTASAKAQFNSFYKEVVRKGKGT